jgi:hypothetical protein
MMDRAQYLKDIEDNIQLDSSLTSNIVIYEANICIATTWIQNDAPGLYSKKTNCHCFHIDSPMTVVDKYKISCSKF